MTGFLKLFSRNMKLMFENIRYRELIMLLLTTVSVLQYSGIGQRPLLSDVMHGIADFSSTPYLPVSWLLIVMFNEIVTGDGFRELILHDYPLVSMVSLGEYLSCSVLCLIVSGGVNLALLLVLTRLSSLHFSVTVFFILLEFMLFFAFLTLVWPPLICEGIVVVTAVSTVFNDGMPCFSRLMAARGSAWTAGDVAFALLMALGIVLCGLKIRKLDFL